MKITIEPTPNLIRFGDSIYRIWSGKTDKGTEVYAIVAALAVAGELAPGETLDPNLFDMTEAILQWEKKQN